MPQAKGSKHCGRHEKSLNDFKQANKGKGLAAYAKSSKFKGIVNETKKCKDCQSKKEQLIKNTKPTNRVLFKPTLKESNNLVLEPFAGSNNLIKMLQEEGYNFDFVAYDINPGSFEVKKRDTIQNFPQGHKLIITNPPYLAKNSACRKKIPFPTTEYDDLYKLCLEIMLKNCDYVGAIIPASFINADLFLDRLHSYTLLSSQMFTDTENPVCLALFSPEKSNSILLYENDEYVGELHALKKQVEEILTNNHSPIEISFNHKQGNLGLRAIDSTRFPSIAFIDAQLVPSRKIKVSSRHLTRIHIPQEVNLNLLNEKLKKLREVTNDFLLTPFRGLRKDAKSDQHFRACFAKDPKKQNIYEKILAEYISSLSFVSNFQKLSSSGKNALYIDRGVLRKGETIQFYAFHKYIEESGGAQDNQFKEIKHCIEVGRNGSQETSRRGHIRIPIPVKSLGGLKTGTLYFKNQKIGDAKLSGEVMLPGQAYYDKTENATEFFTFLNKISGIEYKTISQHFTYAKIIEKMLDYQPFKETSFNPSREPPG
ncbi:15694_t:CDS:2, partial [Racocetra persica]